MTCIKSELSCIFSRSFMLLFTREGLMLLLLLTADVYNVWWIDKGNLLQRLVVWSRYVDKLSKRWEDQMWVDEDLPVIYWSVLVCFNATFPGLKEALPAFKTALCLDGPCLLLKWPNLLLKWPSCSLSSIPALNYVNTMFESLQTNKSRVDYS